MGDGEKYLLLLGLYGAASAGFIFSRIEENHLRFFDIPVYLTILVFVEFGLAPLECFASPERFNFNFAGDPSPLLKALVYVIAGMAAFWAGCIAAGRKWGSKERPPAPTREGPTGRARLRILQTTAGIYAVSLAVKFYLLSHQLYSYLGSNHAYYQNLASMQVLNTIAGIGTYALVIACMEKYLNPRDRKWKVLFWAIFTSECSWGLISGMKGALLENLILLAMISSLIQRRFRKAWVIAAVLGAVVLYPVSNAYRGLLRGGQGAVAVTNFVGAAKVGQRAIEQATREAAGPGAELLSGFRDTVSRLDLLQSVGLILSLGPRAKDLLGSERWWMLPFYPFVPRFLWRSKPILIEGGLFSVALGIGASGTMISSTAVTYPGDCYARGGLAGILFGMFVLGIVAQWLTNTIVGPIDRRRLFVYAAIFLTFIDMEIDYFSFWSGFLKAFVILSITAWLVYGPRSELAGKRAAARALFART